MALDQVMKVPVDRDTMLAIDRAAEPRQMSMAAWVREAIREKMAREQAARLDAAR
jgi:hypothetical protein